MRLRNKARASRSIMTLLGVIRYTRTALAPADEESKIALRKIQKGSYVYPLDELLGVSNLPFKVTVPMMVAIAKEAVRAHSYAEAAECVREHHGVAASAALVREVTDFVAAAVLALDARRAEAAMAELGKRVDRRTVRRRDDDVLYIECDGAMVDIRRGEGRGNEWTECKIGLVFHLRDVRVWVNAEGEVRRAIDKKLLCGHIGHWEGFSSVLLAAALEYDARRCAHVVVISDGAKWIQTMVSRIFPGATHILDLAHVKEHTGDFGRWAVRDGRAASMWIEEAKALVDEGRVDELLLALEPWAGVKTPDNVTNLHTYVSNHRDMMRYGEWREAGYFLGSGAIESANKYVMQNRMKLSGMSWNLETARGMLSLKARLESGRWHEVEPAVRQLLEERSKADVAEGGEATEG